MSSKNMFQFEILLIEWYVQEHTLDVQKCACGPAHFHTIKIKGRNFLSNCGAPFFFLNALFEKKREGWHLLQEERYSIINMIFDN